MLVEAVNKQKPLPSIHHECLTTEEQSAREERSINNEVMRIIQRRDNDQG